MRCLVRERLKVRTPQGTMEVQPGQEIAISDEKLLIDLINGRKVSPLEHCRWRIWSELLQDYLWVVPTLGDAADLIAQGVEEPIYTEEEIDWLRGIDRESLKNIHQAKKAFPGSRVQCHERNKVGER